MRKVLLIFFLGIIGIGTSVYFMSDLQKAKALLFFCGINNELDTSLVQFQTLIKNENFTKVYHFDELPSKHLELIENFDKDNSESYFTLSEDKYAIDEEEWNAGCMPNPDFPFRKLSYFLFNDKYFISSFKTGGFGVSTWYEYYNINQNSLSPIGEINSLSPKLFDYFLRVQIRPEDFRHLGYHEPGPTLENENQ